jgi:hypothetical protein
MYDNWNNRTASTFQQSNNGQPHRWILCQSSTRPVACWYSLHLCALGDGLWWPCKRFETKIQAPHEPWMESRVVLFPGDGRVSSAKFLRIYLWRWWTHQTPMTMWLTVCRTNGQFRYVECRSYCTMYKYITFRFFLDFSNGCFSGGSGFHGADLKIKKKLNLLRLWSICTYFNSPRLKVKILTVGKTFFKINKHENMKILHFFGRNTYHKHFQISSRSKISLAPELVKCKNFIFTTIKKLAC